jgi:methylenetetrahydrofolate dehydrogenase (NADP+) / methenyltetrahydrofolate cyclohydrolase
LYTGLKREAAQRLGIGYQVYEFSFTTPVAEVIAQIQALNHNPTITGIIVQKPWRQTWQAAQTDQTAHFDSWWHELVAAVEPSKDVDGLTPSTLALVQAGNWAQAGRVLPATCQAVYLILDRYINLFSLKIGVEQRSPRVVIIGRSDLVGTPLYWVLKHRGCEVILLGKKELKQGIEEKNYLHGFDVIISATGVAGLITGELIDEGVRVIDVGEPRGDVQSATVREKAQFLTPVPGGVGPMTVVCLMANCVELAKQRLSHKL